MERQVEDTKQRCVVAEAAGHRLSLGRQGPYPRKVPAEGELGSERCQQSRPGLAVTVVGGGQRRFEHGDPFSVDLPDAAHHPSLVG